MGNRECASPQLGAWGLLSGWWTDLTSVSFRAFRCAKRCLGGSGKADSRPAERQRRVEADQIGPAPSDARNQSSRVQDRKFQQDRDPRENPAKRFSWGEDEHRNERAFGVSRKRGIWRLRGRGPAPSADADSTSQGLLLGPPHHKQIRHNVPFCAQALFSSTVHPPAIPRCAPAATAARNTVSAAGHWPP